MAKDKALAHFLNEDSVFKWKSEVTQFNVKDFKTYHALGKGRTTAKRTRL